MNYQQIQDRASLMCALEGWSDTPVSPDFPTLVNRAWFQFSWDAEAVVASQTFSTVIGQAQYTLSGQVKHVRDVIFGTAPVRHSTEDFERNLRADWRVQPNGTPIRYTVENFNNLTLVPPPSTIATVSVRGVVQGTAFASGTDVPPIPDYFHEAIAIYAAYLQGKVYAQGAAADRLNSYLNDYRSYVNQSLGYATLEGGGN